MVMVCENYGFWPAAAALVVWLFSLLVLMLVLPTADERDRAWERADAAEAEVARLKGEPEAWKADVGMAAKVLQRIKECKCICRNCDIPLSSAVRCDLRMALREALAAHEARLEADKEQAE